MDQPLQDTQSVFVLVLGPGVLVALIGLLIWWAKRGPPPKPPTSS